MLQKIRNISTVAESRKPRPCGTGFSIVGKWESGNQRQIDARYAAPATSSQ